MTGPFAGFTGGQIEAMVQRHPLSELLRLQAQYLAEWNRSANPAARTVALLELQLIQHLIGEHPGAVHERSTNGGDGMHPHFARRRLIAQSGGRTWPEVNP